ncbi:MAG: hypothetical protein KC486_33535 [Myxococcales bacterium]|nr:hypothetical protein [Myxococcales bacterium]
MIDYIILPNMRCTRCGEVNERVTEQLYINKEPHSNTYTVGSRFDLPDDVEGFAGCDYVPARPDVVIGPRLRVLDGWTCRCCGAGNLCVLLFEDRVLVEARSVERSLMIFAEVDLVEADLPRWWVHEALEERFPDAEGIEFLYLTEILEVIRTGQMIAGDENED